MYLFEDVYGHVLHHQGGRLMVGTVFKGVQLVGFLQEWPGTAKV